MKKRIFATGLLICLLVSFAAPTVFAAEEDTTQVPTMEFRFGDYGTNGDYLADCTQALMNSYLSNTVNWRFEASSDIYQFRIAGKHPDVTTTGKNLFSPGALQLLGAQGEWFALRLRATETGKFALDLTKAREARIQIYFFPASAVEKALGSNAIAYAQTICAEPYLAGDTEAFHAYKAVIGGLLENATPAMTETVDSPNKMTGEYSFQSGSEYIMVIEFLQETAYRTQLFPLVATWIGEGEFLPEDGTPGPGNQNFLMPAIIAAAVVIVGAVTGVIIARKKGNQKS